MSAAAKRKAAEKAAQKLIGETMVSTVGDLAEHQAEVEAAAQALTEAQAAYSDAYARARSVGWDAATLTEMGFKKQRVSRPAAGTTTGPANNGDRPEGYHEKVAKRTNDGEFTSF